MTKLNDFNDLVGVATAHWDFCHDTAMGLVPFFGSRYSIRYRYANTGLVLYIV